MKLIKKIILTFILSTSLHLGLYAQGSGNTLFFDGNQDYIPINMKYSASDRIAELTVMAWVNVPSFQGGSWAIIDFDRSSNYILTIGAGNLGNGFSDGTGNCFLTFGTSTTTGGIHDFQYTGLNLADDQWHFIAASYAAGTKKLYIDGELVSTATPYGALTLLGNGLGEGTRYGIIGDGSEASTYNGSRNNFFYKGSIDELNIFHAELTQTEIRDWMCKKINPTHPKYPSLQTHFNFDEISDSILDDKNNYYGELKPVSSPPLRQISGAPIGDNNKYILTPSIGSTLSMSHANGSSITVNVTSGSANSLYIYQVDENPNVTTPPAGLDQISQIHYWGIKVFGSSSLTYEVLYDYNGDTGILNENNLRLCSRSDNAATSWNIEPATLNTTNNTLTLGGQTGTEFILGSVSGNPLPVQLVNFEAICKQDKIEITWSTQTEINNDYFVIEKSDDAVQFYELSTIQGSGNSNNINSYSIVDDNSNNNTAYYRLKQVDFDGATTYHYPISINCQNRSTSYIYPNPNKGIVNIVLGGLKNTQVKVFNTTGQLVHQQTNINTPTYQFEITGAKGIYFVELTSDRESKRFKVIKD